MFARHVTSTLRVLAALVVASGTCAAAWAMPAYQDALFARYPNAASALPGCVGCHDGPGAGPLNRFGEAFLANNLAFDAALEALDSDNDGAANGVELTASPATAPGDPKSRPGSSSPPPMPPPAPLPGADGPTLYANHCAACHGALAGSTKIGATLARTENAIAGNVGGMGQLSTLSTTQLQAIVSALAPVAPTSSLNYTGMWWNPGESGWGVNVNHQGDVVFATLFTYDRTGAPLWVLVTALLQPDGRTYAGDLYRASGPAFNAQPFLPITEANLVKVGTMSLSFASAGSGRLSYTYQGVAVSKDIVPQVFGTAAATCGATAGSRAALTNFQDMWWNPAESGWGVNVVHQNSTLFATLMTYDLAGNNLWLVMSAGTLQPDGSYLGDLYRARGPAFDAQPFTPITAANLTKVGTMRLAFADGTAGTLVYTVDGTTVSKSITRQVFASPVPACSSPAQPASPAADGPTLYANHCAVCHGALASSTKGGATLARVQGAIAGDVGGMGYLSTLSAGQLSAVVSALAAVAPTSALPCGSCHAIPPSAGGHAKHDSRASCSSCHGAGYGRTTVASATHNNGIKDLTTSIGWDPTNRSCSNSCHGPASWSATATLACGTCHAIPPKSGEHGEHKSRSCGDCHGSGYSSTTVKSATHNNGIKELVSSTGWNATSRSCTNACHGKESW